ncbi:MAG: transketolase [Clostridiales Family XIII bacterium]|jgi:transketolase|nr:transketolase [Clostridiales Family XIII bacterium]
MKQKAINAIRILSADMVQQANSGHPGFPLGAAPIIYEVFAEAMKHSPEEPAWFDRDRFVLSAGHGSAMLYATLHLFGYPDISLEQLKNFRQFNSLTPGHPEYGHTPGVEATTGPLGAGMGMAVGMALAEAHLAAKFNKDDIKLVDHYTFALGGEGCLMEGISSEVFSLAGTLGLGKLIVIFDNNDITIEGGIQAAFTEDIEGRMRAFGFQVLTVEDGTDAARIGEAIEAAKAETSKPSFIRVKTTIGYGVPDRAGTAKAHGEPLGEENCGVLRQSLGWPSEERFFVPDDIRDHFAQLTRGTAAERDVWYALRSDYRARYPEDAALFDAYLAGEINGEIFGDPYFECEAKADATRSISGRILNDVKDKVPFLIGGSADLAPSNKTEMKGESYFSAGDRLGRNIHFGVRELGMTAIANGILLHGGLRAFVATFFVFSDYMKPMLRLSALMKLPLISVLTHDSIGVGEDGPTHQPVEQLAMLRATPGIDVQRPADEYETRVAWKAALTSKDTPTVLVLSRQNLPALEGSGPDAANGAYIVSKENGNSVDAILLASGSEVSLCIDAQKLLEADGYSVRVVSVPCMEQFERMPADYKERVLPSSVSKRVAVEAGSGLSWGRLVGPSGAYVTMESFGASAPASVLFEHFGFTKDAVAAKARELICR